MQTLYRMDDIRKFSYTGGFDDDTVRMIFLHNFFQRSSKISHQRTADTTGIHLTDLDTCILQKTAVNTDLTKFIFDQNDLLTFEGIL